MTNTIVALYDDMDTAHKVVRDLRDSGVPNSNISLVAQDASGEYAKYTTAKVETADGAATGAGVGAVIGGIGGLLVGLGALTIPGIGPVLAAGPLASAIAALIGAGAGAVAGGLLGALIDLGIPEEHAGYYAEGVRRGGALVTVDAADSDIERLRGLMNRYHPVDIHQRVESWRETGWKGYDAKAKPYTAKQTTKDRETYASASRSGEPQMTPSGVMYYPRKPGMSSTSMSGMGNGDMERYRAGWRGHYQTQFANTGYKYEQYEPAYEYGWSLRNEARYRDYDWARLEPEARRTWEQRYPGSAWDQIKAAVRYSWESFKEAVRD
jgi:uncharacterized membrane protein